MARWIADVRAQGRLAPVIALALAVAALGTVLTAIAVVARRPARVVAAPAPELVAARRLEERAVPAAALVELEGIEREVVGGVAAPGADAVGVRLVDAALAQRLGLEPGDVITAMSGREVRRAFDLRDALRAARTGRAVAVYVEITRGDARRVERWAIEGDHRAAWLDARGARARPGGALFGGAPASGGAAYVRTRASFRRAEIDGLLRGLASAGRLTPAVRGGQVVGVTVHALAAGGLLARLTLEEGDLLRRIDGEAVTSPDDVLARLARLGAAHELTIDGERGGAPAVFEVSIAP